ncbi:MAG: FecR domain-containing protein [Chitinophagaceae bacterium]
MAKKDPGSTSLQSAYRMGYLLAGYIKKSLTEDEMTELDAWRRQQESNEKLFQEYTNAENVDRFLEEYTAGDTEMYLEKSKEKIREIERSSRRQIWRNVAAAVIVIAVTGALIFIMTGKRNEIEQPVARATETPSALSAVLTVNGTTAINIFTDSRDTVFANGNRLKIADKQLSYSVSSAINEEHLLSVPAKGFFKVVLPDGTRVSINSGSSIRYSTTFSKGERRVQLKGEAYFEVAHDKDKPFRVECTGGEVEALGTAFNVKAYDNGRSFTTTLTEGRVRISAGKSQVTLQPGEHAVVRGNDLVKGAANTGAALGWSKNEFVFNETPLTDVMDELSRWYGFEVEYKATTQPTFRFATTRDTSLLFILSIMEKTNEVHFEVNEKKITVTN